MLSHTSRLSRRRLLYLTTRPRSLLTIALVAFTFYYLIFSASEPDTQVVSSKATKNGKLSLQTGVKQVPYWDIQADDLRNWRDPDDSEDPNDIEPGYEQDGKSRDEGAISRLAAEKDYRKIWRYVYKATSKSV